jgi:hypothetical protein
MLFHRIWKFTDLRAIIAVIAIMLLTTAYDALGQTSISRKCPGSSPSPATASVAISKAGAIAITPCNGQVANITGTTEDNASGVNGSAATPTFSFTGDPDTGMYRSAANTLAFSTGGTQRATLTSFGGLTVTNGVSTNNGFFTGQITHTQGTITESLPLIVHTATWNSAPTTFVNFSSDVTDTASAAASKLIDLKVGGSSQFTVRKDGLTTVTGAIVGNGTSNTFAGVMLGPSGGANAPAWSFSTDADTGMYRKSADMVGFSTGGSERVTIGSTGLATTGLTATAGITSSSPTAGIGYSTGAGGAQVQGAGVGKATTVVSNTITTAVTMNNAALNAATIVSFTFTNSAIGATDQVICTHESAGTSAAYSCNAFPGVGSAVVSVRNNTAGNLSEAIVLRLTVIKAVSN